MEVNPTTTTVGASLLYALLPIFTFLSFHPLLSRGLSGDGDRFISISDANRQRQTKLERQRDIFRVWAEHTGRILMLCLAIWGVPVLIGSLFGSTHVTRSWAFVNVIVVGIQTLTYFAVLKGVNKRSVDALQQQIEAHR
jgi:bacteriorhodopsin